MNTFEIWKPVPGFNNYHQPLGNWIQALRTSGNHLETNLLVKGFNGDTLKTINDL